MLNKKIIACLDIKDGQVVKGVNFECVKQTGDPLVLAKFYSESNADELVMLDISATLEKRDTILDLVQQVAQQISIPLIVGGGINSVEAAQKIIACGASKIAVNSAAILRPELIRELAQKYGSSKVVVAIDVKQTPQGYRVVSQGGTHITQYEPLQWALLAQGLGAGAILLTSIGTDGMQKGFDLQITGQLAKELTIEVIASGGAGSYEDFEELFTKTNAQSALAASVFHFNTLQIPQLKQRLKNKNINVL